jgi:hypothetical protein
VLRRAAAAAAAGGVGHPDRRHQRQGSFVGLGVLVIGLWAIPGTALINFLGARARPPVPALRLALRVLLTSTIYPLAMILLYAVAS